MRRYLYLLLACSLAAEARPVLVLSVDGLDQRYLSDCDRLGLKIPNLRRLMREGKWSSGVVGVVPTVTWPSHTTIITGVDPSVHGILGNQKPKSEGGDYYWSADLLRSKSLLVSVKEAGLASATITWPVTVDAPVRYNLPEYFHKRRGGAMDTASIASKSQPADLVSNITAMFPSFPQEWMDDRTRSLATIYLLKVPKPDLILVHFVDLDSEAHDDGPFSREANAVLEYTDELIGNILAAMPPDYAFVLVSDHGFERVDAEVNLKVLAAQKGVQTVQTMGGIAVAGDAKAAEFLRSLRADARYGIGREIPKEEVARFAPRLAGSAAVFESAPNYWFGFKAEGEILEKPREAGTHGHWPTRYRAVYVEWSKGKQPERLPEISQKEIVHRLAGLLGVSF